MKATEIDDKLFRKAVNSTAGPFVIADAQKKDQPIIFANEAFLQLLMPVVSISTRAIGLSNILSPLKILMPNIYYTKIKPCC
jgi:hypothetical protein